MKQFISVSALLVLILIASPAVTQTAQRGAGGSTSRDVEHLLRHLPQHAR